MRPQPTSPTFILCIFFLSSSNTGEGIFQSPRDIIHVFFGIAFVPRKDQYVRETRGSAWEIGRVVVHRGFLGPAFSVVGPVTRAEGALIAKHFTHKRRLLDIARGRGDIVFFPQHLRHSVYVIFFQADAVLPVNVRRPWGGQRKVYIGETL